MDREKVVIHCHKSDLKKVAVTCICGVRSVVEIPKQVAGGKNMHTCPNLKCQRVHLFQFISGQWTHEVKPFGLDQTLLSSKEPI